MKPSDFTIGTRLKAGFCLMLLLTLAVGGGALFQIGLLSDITERLYKHPFTVNTALRDMRGQTRVIDIILADLVPGTPAPTLELRRHEISMAMDRIQNLFSIISERYLGSKNDIALARASFHEWAALNEEVFSSRTEDRDRETQIRAVVKSRQHVHDFVSKLQTMIDFAGRRALAFHEEAVRERDASIQFMGLLLACAVLTAVGVAVGIARGITRPLEQVVERIKNVAVGDFGENLEMRRKDEIGELADAFRGMRAGLQDKVAIAQAVAQGDLSRGVAPAGERDVLGQALDRMISALRLASEVNTQNDWIKTGKNELSALLSGELDARTLSERVVGFLTPYLKARIGAVYLLGQGDTLALTGSYAFTLRKGLSDSFRLGQGLVGQAALEGKTISVTQLPEDYIRINSALGEAQPRNIVVMPILHEGRVKGVLELGSFEEMNAVQIDFLQSVSESIGLAVATVENQVRVRELLEETQFQAAKLLSQQEELRSTNEELEQQAQALRTSEEELRVQQEELQTANEELSEKNAFLEQQQTEISLKNMELDNARMGLEQKARELEVSGRYKSDFLANMSHELRTPLNSLLLLSRNLMDNSDGNLTPEQVEFARIIFGSGNDLLTLINEILDLSKIEAGKMTLRLEDVDLADLASSLAASFRPMIDEKGLILDVGLDEGLPGSVHTDRQRLEQILRNFLSNAVKFCEHGGVTVRFRLPDPSLGGLARHKALAISVTDTGVGIPEDKHQEIFEAFQQVEGGAARKYAGTGLGLTISRELARLLGGEIHLRSAPDEGSTFTLLIPLEGPGGGGGDLDRAAMAQTGPESALRPTASGLRPRLEPARAVPSIPDDRGCLRPDEPCILIIEDDPGFVRVLAEQCHSKGFQVLASATGEEGLDLARRSIPAAVILDIKLPGMNGWQVLDELKQDPALRHIPVHVMSGVEGGRDALQRGAVGFLAKPASREALDEAFGRMEGVWAKKVKDLLLVEDDEGLRQGVAALIGDPGVHIHPVASGAEALAALKERRFDCMILDLGLPDMSGFELLDRIKAQNAEGAPPVIVYTGRDLNREEARRLREHADSIIVKGVRSEERLVDETALFLHQMVKTMPTRKRDMIMHLYDKDAIFKDRTVLLVDDDMRNLFALSQVLQGKGLNIIKAEDGRKALEVLETEPKVDMVLMDIMMPGMDGYETTRRIRAQRRFKSLPVIALTAKAMLADREKCFEAGASDYLSKPVDVDRLLSVMRVWLHK